MLPLNVDVARMTVVLAGQGDAVARRLALLDQAGAGALTVFCPHPSPALAQQAGDRLRRRWPEGRDLGGARLVLIAGVADEVAEHLAARATAQGALVNVEDAAALCDVHMPAVVRRGALSIAIATDGCSPGLAHLIKGALERVFDVRWGVWLDELAARRAAWRAGDLAVAEVSRHTAALVRTRGWLAWLENRVARGPSPGSLRSPPSPTGAAAEGASAFGGREREGARGVTAGRVREPGEIQF
jgi:precorrin-2 dehydrogenase/sirohydrochlorin ferrochelatase